MDFRTRKTLAIPERQDEGGTPSFEIGALTASLEAHDVSLGSVITFDEVRLNSAGLVVGSNASVRARELVGTFIISESSLNRFLASRVADSVKDVEVAVYVGKLRISGRYTKMGIPVPFQLYAVPMIEGGARIQLDPGKMNLSVLAMPGFSANFAAERINFHLAKAFDTTRFPIPVRMTDIRCETGRLLISATASLSTPEIQPGDK